jgi:PKD repeat protein
MLFEYNPTYIGDSSTSLATLTVQNYGLLIVPTTEMSTQAATAISTYITNGGSVWFLNDPSMTPTFGPSVQLSGILGSGVSSSIGSSTVAVVNTDPITAGLSASFVPVGTAAKTAEFRSLPAMSGTISGLNYQVLMGTNTKAMLVKFENPTNGARVIYSNPDMFISGGTASYFNAATATKLFTQTKAWIFKFASNPNGIEVTYPNSDKQLTVTSDDEECTDYDVKITPMINAETAALPGISPASYNTFFIIPNVDMVGGSASTYGVNYYANLGDTHTLHPHMTKIGTAWAEATWDKSTLTAATDLSYMNTLKGVVNTAVGSSNYGFNSFRFPYTTYCANSMQSISDGGFVIDTSSGCDSPATGTTVDNTILLPKATLVNNVKTNTIEYELPADFDINYATGTAFGTAYNAVSSEFKNVNFPANFVVSGHYQGMATNCGVPGWGVTSTGLTAGLTSILTTQKGANPNYATFNTLSSYLTGIKNAKVSAVTDGAGTTTVTVTPTQAITGFTLKIGVGTPQSVTCDGVSVATKTDSTTGAIYVTKDLSATTHTFVISTLPPTPTQPTVSFTTTSAPIDTGATVNFVASVTGYPAPTVTWSFGDNTATTTGISVSHVFTNTGTTAVVYTVTATASNGVGTPATFSGTVTVKPAAPTAAFTYTPTSGITTSTTVSFTDTSTNNPTTSAWLFGDGGSATGKTVTHKFTKAGSMSAKLTTTNAGGSATVTKTITVGAVKPVASFTYSPTTVKRNVAETFTSTSTNYPTSYKWTFSDTKTTVTTTATTTKHTYTKTGSFTVSLVATNSAGSSTILTKTIRVA